jgi:hypothetical protein
MSPKSTRRAALCAVVGALLLTPGAAEARSKPAGEPASGHWTSQIPCINTPLEYFDPVTNKFECTGVSNWTGTWNGQCFYHAHGTIDPLTGYSTGSIDETVVTVTADGHKGETFWYETFENHGALGHIDIEGTLLGGSGDFEGATGNASFIGDLQLSSSGSGTYTGRWSHPAY